MTRRFLFLTVAIGVVASCAAAQGPRGFLEKTSNSSTNKSGDVVKPQGSPPMLVIWVRRDDGKLVFEMNNHVYAKDEINDELGELALNGRDRLIVTLIEDSVLLTDMKEIPKMALDAGFRKFSTFIIWKKTGSMAELLLARHDDNYVELLYGPAHHATNKPKKLARRITHIDEPNADSSGRSQ